MKKPMVEHKKLCPECLDKGVPTGFTRTTTEEVENDLSKIFIHFEIMCFRCYETYTETLEVK